MEQLQANILDGIYVRVGGPAGHTNGIAWHMLENMFGHLQELINLLAKYELETDNSPNIKAFELELYDFQPGSAIPAFRIRRNEQYELYPVVNEQKQVVAAKFDKLMALANDHKYDEFFPEGQLLDVTYDIAEELNGFILAAENSPLSIVKPKEGIISEIYKVPKFSVAQSQRLLRPKIRRKNLDAPEQIVGIIQRVGKRRTIVDLYENKDTIVSIAPSQIILEDKIYHLHTPLLCTVSKDEGNFIIENDMLDLVAYGQTLDEAEHDLYAEFDSSFELLNGLRDEDLSERLLRAKIMLNNYVKEITQD